MSYLLLNEITGDYVVKKRGESRYNEDIEKAKLFYNEQSAIRALLMSWEIVVEKPIQVKLCTPQVCKDCVIGVGFTCGYCDGLFTTDYVTNEVALNLGICDDCYEDYYLEDLQRDVEELKKDKDTSKK